MQGASAGGIAVGRFCEHYPTISELFVEKALNIISFSGSHSPAQVLVVLRFQSLHHPDKRVQ
ncbi:hypothetical protein HanPSC8_Chr01g0028111 [Helianthus annuus]|nr:hypothetical protein HanPSC8_Chr01g0028111 [Helianthus annuus]